MPYLIRTIINEISVFITVPCDAGVTTERTEALGFITEENIIIIMGSCKNDS
jgi:hypothetical protein